MKTLIAVFSLFFLLQVIGCCSSNKSNSSTQLKQESTAVIIQPFTSRAPTTIKQNATRVEAVIDRVELFSDRDYLLSITIVSSSPVEGVESIIEGEQKLDVQPEYLCNDEGKIDLKNERNKKLLKLQACKVGDIFSGIISRNANGRVVLVEVLEK